MDNYAGWENYYKSNKSTSKWKDETEPFLLDNAEELKKCDYPMNVLDVACGDGRNTGYFYQNNDKVCCVDISETALQILDSKYPNATKVCCNVMDAPLLENQFDIVLCFDGLAQMENPEMALRKLIDFARIGGLIVYNLFTPDDCAFGEGEKVDERTFNYKDTLFKFYTMEEALNMIPPSVTVLKKEIRHWSDPPHGSFRPYIHEHDASFFLLRKL